MQKRLTSLVLLALLGGCTQPRSDATNYYRCDLTASAPFVTLVVQGDIESIMALADGTYIDIAEATYTPLAYRRCKMDDQGAVVIEPLSQDQADRLKRHFEANAEGSQATIHQLEITPSPIETAPL